MATSHHANVADDAIDFALGCFRVGYQTKVGGRRYIRAVLARRSSGDARMKEELRASPTARRATGAAFCFPKEPEEIGVRRCRPWCHATAERDLLKVAGQMRQMNWLSWRAFLFDKRMVMADDKDQAVNRLTTP